MVDMAVGIDEPDRFQSEIVDGFQEFCAFCGIAASGIYYRAFQRFIIYHVGIFTERPEGQF